MIAVGLSVEQVSTGSINRELQLSLLMQQRQFFQNGAIQVVMRTKLVHLFEDLNRILGQVKVKVSDVFESLSLGSENFSLE